MKKKSAGDQTGTDLNSDSAIPSDLAKSPSAPPSSAEPSSKPTPTVDLSAADNLGDLPRGYGTDTIFLVAQEPHWLFTYWDIDISRHPGGKSFLRIYENDELVEDEIEVPFETRNWYIPVKSAGSRYAVEIGYYRGQTWNVIARSVTISTPPDHVSESTDFDYATIPLHMSFQRLMDNIQASLKGGESLISALARLQKDGDLVAFGAGDLPNLSLDQRTVLEALLGKDLLEELSSGAFSSEEIESRVKAHLDAKLNSGSASELLARHQWGSAESSLFSVLSAISSGAFASGALSSGAFSSGALSSGALSAGALSSGGFSSGAFSAGALSSWAAAALTSWAAAASIGSSWSGQNFTSWAAAAGSSWGAETLSSWLQAAQSSWAAAAGAGLGSAALSSWSHAESSWSGASETVSSFSGAPGQRNFFMHVNAEVIFYGGTDPRAKVTIDGKPITLNPDGTFRHHFIFPDGAYEIPIVAVSPDGVETRSALLRFDRATTKHGGVDDTAQPPLGAPMGALSSAS